MGSSGNRETQDFDGTGVPAAKARPMGAGEVKGTRHCIQWQPAWLNHEKATARWQREQFNANSGVVFGEGLEVMLVLCYRVVLQDQGQEELIPQNTLFRKL